MEKSFNFASTPLSDNNTDYFACTQEEVMAATGDLVMMERSNIDNFTLGPFTINSEQYARQLVNLSESDSHAILLHPSICCVS